MNAQVKETLPAVIEAGSMLDAIQRAASDPQTDVAKMQALMGMAMELKRVQAEQLFNEALRAVQAEVPRIKRDRTNSHTRSNYATLEAVNKALVPVYTSHGFGLSFGTADSPLPDHYRVTCRVSHIGGHSERYQHDVPTDAAGAKGTANKNATQAAGSALSYGRRYLTALIFNLTTTDDDDAAGASATVERIGPGQTADLDALIEEVKADKVAFLAFFGIEKVADLPLSKFDQACGMLRQRGRKAK